MICDFCGQDERERILTQELIIYLGQIAKNEIELIDDILTLRVGHLLQLLIAHGAQARGVSFDMAFDALLDKPPHQLFALLRDTLAHFGDEQRGRGTCRVAAFEHTASTSGARAIRCKHGNCTGWDGGRLASLAHGARRAGAVTNQFLSAGVGLVAPLPRLADW
jgi:hypothetical protein